MADLKPQVVFALVTGVERPFLKTTTASFADQLADFWEREQFLDNSWPGCDFDHDCMLPAIDFLDGDRFCRLHYLEVMEAVADEDE